MKTDTKTKIISFLHTLLGTFGAELLAAITVLPDGTITNAEFWKTGAATAVLIAVCRSTVKTLWLKMMPVSLGGRKK